MPLPDLAEAAADAFTEGWLLSGCEAEFTEAEFCAAVGAALDCGDHPGVLEATLDLGHLTGTWKTVYGRRERLLRKHLRAVAAAWDACLDGLDPRDMVRQFRSVMDLTAEASDPDRQWWKDAATTAAVAWLRRLYQAGGYLALVAAIEDAIRSGMAEGEADALALAASRQGETGFSIAKAFTAAYDRLADDASVSQQAADALASIVDGAAADIGRELTDQAGDGGSEDDMTSAAAAAVSGDGSRSVRTWADWAVSAAILTGARGVYRIVAGALGGPVQVDWITAGDGRVCATCDGYERNGPYSPDDVPGYPHPGCRCSTHSRTRFPSSFLTAAAAFLTGTR